MSNRPRVFVDAGFRDGEAGLGAWLPALGTGVSLTARAADNNEAEALAILLGLVVGKLMFFEQALVLTDSRANVAKLANAMPSEGISLEWRPREITSLADFFATLGLNGKSLIAVTANAANPEEKFRPLLRLENRSKATVKDVGVRWLSRPNPPRAPFDLKTVGLHEIAPGLAGALGAKIPIPEFRVLVEEFSRRAERLSRSL